MSAAKNWCFTFNNYTEDDLLYMESIGQNIGPNSCINYIVYGKEIAPTSGTPHLQGYVQFKKRLRLSQVKKIISNRINCRIANGTPFQNRLYCMKDDDAQEFGVISTLGSVGFSYMRSILIDY